MVSSLNEPNDFYETTFLEALNQDLLEPWFVRYQKRMKLPVISRVISAVADAFIYIFAYVLGVSECRDNPKKVV